LHKNRWHRKVLPVFFRIVISSEAEPENVSWEMDLLEAQSRDMARSGET
jgi:hypothetical protein